MYPDRALAKPVPIRRSLLLNLLVVVTLLSVATVGIMWLSARRAVRKLSASVIEQALDRAEVELEGLFYPVERQLATLQAWVEGGLARIADPAATEELLTGPVRAYPWTTAMFLADERGQFYVLNLRQGVWSTEQIQMTPGGRVHRRFEWTDDEPTHREVEPIGSGTPQDRPWYDAAMQGAGQLVWTEPYTYAAGPAGITATAAWRRGDEAGVIGVDVTLLQISRYTTGLRILDGGVVFVLTGDGRMLGLPRNPQRWVDDEAIDAAVLKRPDELDAPAPQEVFHRLLATGAPPDEPRRLVTAAGTLWAQARPFELATGRELLIGVAVPEEDLLGELRRWRLGLVLFIVALVALAIWRAARLASHYSLPIESLVAESGRMATGDLEPGEPIASNVAEVRQLTEAHDKMRAGLRTLLKLEHDLKVARQIQQKILPETLPEVAGFELEAWNEPADETGGDSYDLIGLRHASAAEKVVMNDGDGDADRALLLLADATGHGIGPALSVTQVRAMLRMAARLSADLGELARHLNEQLCADLPRSKFITAWLGLLDSASHSLTSFSAGQGPLLHFHAATGECDVLGADSIPMGMFAGAPITIPEPIALGPGDIFAVISDGIFEAKGPDDEELGVDRAVAVLRRHHQAPASDILDRIRRAVEAFTGGAPADDDRTIILIKRLAS